MPYGSSGRDHQAVIRDPDAKPDFEPTNVWKSNNTPKQEPQQPAESTQPLDEKDRKASKPRRAKEVSSIASHARKN